ncbi:MAG: hypothetical protein PHP01_03770 [Phycisphaerae bacterium]|nr:hypothetical protein [Phycisphaerae bacterium]
MTIDQITEMMFDNLDSTDIVLAVLGRNGSCVSNRPEIFTKVFADQKLHENLCCKIDDGAEPVISKVDDCLVVASSLCAGIKNLGYVVMLLPGYSPEKSFEYLDFIEIIMNQFSLLAGVIEENRQLSNMDRISRCGDLAGVLAGVN